MFRFWKPRGAGSVKRRRQRSSPVRPGIESLELRIVPASVLADYEVTQDWGSGFQGAIRLANEQSTTIEDWTVEFDFAANITSLWDAQLVSHVGDHYVITGANWNADLPAGGNVGFGFVAGPDASAPLTNVRINGESVDDSAPPTLTVDDVTTGEEMGTGIFTVHLSRASDSEVTANFATIAGTATSDLDYLANSGTVTFAPGQTEQIIEVPLVNDSLVEANESFTLRISDIVGAEPSWTTAQATIVDDDVPVVPPTPDNITFTVQSDWGSGFTGQITITNTDTNALNDWTLEFDFPGTISSIWNAQIVSQTGDHHVIQPVDWNRSIAEGTSVTFGFVASPGNGVAVPHNFVLDGTSVIEPNPDPQDPDPGDPSSGLQANDDYRHLVKDQQATIDVLANDVTDGPPASLVAGTAQEGQTTVKPDGTITYTPNSGFTGVDSFSYTITDAEGNSASATVHLTVTETASVWPDSVFAPYVDMLLYPTYDLVTAARDHGVQFTTLAFITADSQGQAAWGGFDVYSVGGGSDYEANLKAQLSELRALGGDVMVSFGGAIGQEIAEVIPDVKALQAEYQKVIDAYQLTRIDFDIEGAAILHQDVIDRRSQAIAALQQEAALAGRELYVSYTLPVLPTGLTPGGVYVLESALKYGVRIDEVNIMAMDYGDAAAPNPDGQMGEYAIQAANSLFQQMRVVYNDAGIVINDEQIWQSIAVTPMIGLNDVVTETFNLQDAHELLAFAKEKDLARLSMWSLNRDRYQEGVTYVSPTSSSYMQDPLAFSNVFLGLMDDAN